MQKVKEYSSKALKKTEIKVLFVLGRPFTRTLMSFLKELKFGGAKQGIRLFSDTTSRAISEEKMKVSRDPLTSTPIKFF